MAAFAQNTPAARLFHFERSKNANYVCYDVNQKDGKLDMKDPIEVYWIRAAEGGEKKELSFFQRVMAFGYKVVSKGNNEVTVHLTAYNKLNIRICRRNGKWVALVNINGKEARLTKMYVKTINPDSLKVEYVDIFGVDTATGKNVKQRITQ